MSEVRNFPSQKLSHKKKGKQWRKDHLDWADSNSYLSNSAVRRKLKQKRINLNLYNGKIDVNDMKLILNPGGLEKFFVPDAIQHYPIITPRVNVLVGEEKRRKRRRTRTRYKTQHSTQNQRSQAATELTPPARLPPLSTRCRASRH